MTFIGLGNFIECLEPKKHNWLRTVLFPFIFRCALNIEQYNTDTLPYCVREQEYNVSIPFSLAASVVACSFLCLIPTHPSWNLLMNEANFTYFFASITNASCPQAQKLRSLFDYFEHCRHFRQSPSDLSSEALRITRRILTITPPPFLPLCSLGNVVPRLDGGKRELIRVLSTIPLPYMLVDDYHSVESVADRLRVPMTHFVNAYVGGNVLRSDGPTDDSLFFRYPDLLTCLPLCHRLEDAEALWIDHFRGPFVPSKSFPSDYVATDPEKLKWRRLVCMNTSCFPSWASELQYSDACLISEVTKACAAFFGVSQSTMMAASPTPPFSSAWWEAHLYNNKDTNNETDQEVGYVQHAVPKPRKIVVTQSHGSPVILMSRAHCLLNTAELLTESIVREAGNFALELKHRVFPSFHASADLLEHRSTLLRHIRPNHTKGRSFSLRAPQNVVGLVQPTAGHRHSPHGQPHVSDAYIEQFSADLCTVSRASFSGSASSGSAASYCLSSNRSSFSRGGSLSTQSSVHRFSEFSSNGSNFLVSCVADGSSSELHEFMEHEAKGLCSALGSPPCSNTVTEMLSSRQLSSLNARPNRNALKSKTINRLRANIEQTILKTPERPRIFSDLLSPDSAEQSDNVKFLQRETELLLMPLAEKLIDQTVNEAKSVALIRSTAICDLASRLSTSILADSVRVAIWFQNWSKKLLCEASTKAEQLYKSRTNGESTHHLSSPISVHSRRFERTAKRGGTVRENKRPRGMHSVLSRGSRSSGSSMRYFLPVQFDFGEGNSSSGSPSLSMQHHQHGHFRFSSHEFSKRQHNRIGEDLPQSEKLHHQRSSNAEVSPGCSAPSNANRTKGGYPAGWRFRFSPTHQATFHTISRRPVAASVTPHSKPPNTATKEQPWSFSRESVHIYVSNQLHRFAGSVASECCARALQQLRVLQSGSRGTDQARVRPSGLVTSSWNKHTVNPAADPQVKVMTQWIAAAVVSTPSNRSSVSIVRDPVPVKDQTIVGSDGSSTPIEKSASVSEIDSTHFIEYRISPLILCTNNDPRLKELEKIVGLIYAAQCSAGVLLSLLMDYGAYRLTTNRPVSIPDCSRLSRSTRTQSLFDFLQTRLVQMHMTPTMPLLDSV
ncbi:Poly(ADP-ribose) glycohydrolase [Fasciolopsis buskii]|uniref:poly(ADP-ribose) glycohydrolase n=1 Tax=Fasciolopsis buskii TaxID=27845 RepID=A0A8E0RUH4_9TREM|nr:Poly(ADP-ribose) glycohydrolase [Fasciolopsis buski]